MGGKLLDEVTKCCASSSASVPRERSGGTSIWMTLIRKNRSSRKRPSSTAESRSRLVAVRIRAPNGTSSGAPTGRTLLSSNALSSFGCIVSGISPISSRTRTYHTPSVKRGANCEEAESDAKYPANILVSAQNNRFAEKALPH